MKRSVGRVWASFVFFGLAWASMRVQADEPWSTDRLVELAESATTESTLGYLHIDLEKAPARSLTAPAHAVDAVTPRLTLALGEIEEELALQGIDVFARAFGLREALIVVAPARRGLRGELILRVDERCDRSFAQKTLSKLELFEDVRFEDDVLHLTMEDYTKGPAATVDREALQAAFATLPQYPCRAIFFPQRIGRGMVGMLAPREPEAMARLLREDVARDLKWAVASYDPSGRGRVEALAVAVDAPAATRLRDDLKQSSAFLLQAARDEKLLERMRLDLDFGRELYRLTTPTVEGNEIRLIIDGSDPATAALLAKAAEGGDRLATPAQSFATSVQFKQIALALHNHHDTYKRLPPSPVQSLPEGGNIHPGLSWRVLILPFLEQQDLYDRFRLNEPWDSEHNRALIGQMPEIYASADPAVPAGKTTVVLPLFDGAPASQPRSVRFADMIDGLSNTLLVVEAAPGEAVVWTQPDDLEIDLDKFAELVGPKISREFTAAFADGAVMQVPKSLDRDLLRRLLQHQDGASADLRKSFER